MNGVETSLYSAALALCVFSAGLVRHRPAERGRSPVYFTAFLAIEALSFACELLMAHPATPLKCLWLASRMGLALLLAPCLWLVVRDSVEAERPALASLGRRTVAGIAAGWVLLLPLMSAAHFGTDYPDPARPASWWYSKTIHTGMLGCIAIFAVQVPVFLRRSQRILNAQPAASRWGRLPLAVVLTVWLLGLLRTAQCISHAPRELDLLFATVDVSVTVGAIYLVVRRPVVVAEEIERLRVVETSAGPEPVAVTMVAGEERAETKVAAARPRKYARSALDAATLARVRRKIEAALARPDVLGDSLLNLREFSRAIGEKAHYVSQTINQELGMTFYELVSRHRVELAQRRLLAAPERTVLEIALEAGFNSKSTFHTAFRRCTGMTPTEWRAKAASAARGAVDRPAADAT